MNVPLLIIGLLALVGCLMLFLQYWVGDDEDHFGDY